MSERTLSVTEALGVIEVTGSLHDPITFASGPLAAKATPNDAVWECQPSDDAATVLIRYHALRDGKLTHLDGSLASMAYDRVAELTKTDQEHARTLTHVYCYLNEEDDGYAGGLGVEDVAHSFQMSKAAASRAIEALYELADRGCQARGTYPRYHESLRREVGAGNA
jgi:hypothetical protein